MSRAARPCAAAARRELVQRLGRLWADAETFECFLYVVMLTAGVGVLTFAGGQRFLGALLVMSGSGALGGLYFKRWRHERRRQLAAASIVAGLVYVCSAPVSWTMVFG